ncbi:MAG: SDR family NAD(P)-dependent oxidoreductase [Gammaproteobacteria bacterium]|nr:SDR family NAD(P)-dependent oxidoreductase [Gammaproteobacteria bacterium]
MANRFEGKVAIVTGGNSGIGEATGRQFAAEGAKTVLMARREEQGQAVAESIRASGGEATFIRCDVSDYDAVEAAVAAAAGARGPPGGGF